MKKIEKLLAAYAGPAQDIENAIQQLIADSIDNAVGAQLDVFGRLVGQMRNGQGDDQYRRYVRARILTNRSHGVTEDLISIAVVLLDTLLVPPVQVITQQTATTRVRIFGGPIGDDVAADLNAFLQQGKAAGVRLILEWIDVVPAQAFTLDVGPGLDQGHFAGSLG